MGEVRGVAFGLSTPTTSYHAILGLVLHVPGVLLEENGACRAGGER